MAIGWTKVRGFLGLLLYSRALKANHHKVEELWQSDGSSVAIFRLVMPIKLLKLLLQCLGIDNKDSRKERSRTTKLPPIRELFDVFVSNCKNGYSLSKYDTIDDKLEGFKRRCSFRQYLQSVIPSKRNSFRQYIPSKRNIPLLNTLLCNFQLTVLGTIRKNKAEFPLKLLGTIRKNKAEFPLKFTEAKHLNLTLVSYVPKRKKNVLLISSLYHDDTVDETTRKPAIIMDKAEYSIIEHSAM
ncbi:Transposase IS4 [Popillia japonica]|uniref:Transposase IS4 n=1 Tax=Popillia japonica TaxID=7064 RepID=A0AAW1N0Q1_POPJA